MLSHPKLPGQESRLIPPTGLPVRFTLALEWQQDTYDYPMQTWQATSDLSLRDYTGDYILELIPCMATKAEYFSMSPGGAGDLNCEPKAAKQFILPISFHQGNRPPPLVYSLNTDFQLSHGDQVFQADSNAVADTAGLAKVEDENAFGKGWYRISTFVLAGDGYVSLLLA